jgi:exopolyphosphatase / guanosine-5'-triphosphate,3'-diphosphate pyrophosphatase
VPSRSRRGTIGAAVDLGSTSVHLLVARVVEHRLEPLVDESAFLGLGDAVAGRGSLGPAGREALVDTLAHQAWTARRSGATHLVFVATEPLRRLADAARIVGEIDRGAGVAVHALTHEEEALLTLVGVTGGRPVSRDLLVVDIGGGSSEFVSVGPGRRAAAAGVRIGAASLSAAVGPDDPPAREALATMRDKARDAVSSAPAGRPSEIAVVGGTASNLLKVLGEDAGHRLDRAGLRAVRRLVVAEPAAAIAERAGIRPQRARLLGAGGAIVEAILDRYGASAARVSPAGIREGAVLAAVHAGSAWRDRLEELAHGWLR